MALFGRKNKEKNTTKTASELKITVENEGKVYTFMIEGRLDTTTSPLLDEKISEVIEYADKLIFDLGSIVYISSAGLRVFLGAKQQIEDRGEMIVRNLTREVREVFDLVGFSSLFTIE